MNIKIVWQIYYITLLVLCKPISEKIDNFDKIYLNKASIRKIKSIDSKLFINKKEYGNLN